MKLECTVLVDLSKPGAYETACNDLLAALVADVFEDSHYKAGKVLGMHRASIAHRIGPSKRKPLENGHARARARELEQAASAVVEGN